MWPYGQTPPPEKCEQPDLKHPQAMLQDDICPQNSPRGGGFRLLAHGLLRKGNRLRLALGIMQLTPETRCTIPKLIKRFSRLHLRSIPFHTGSSTKQCYIVQSLGTKPNFSDIAVESNDCTKKPRVYTTS